MALPAIGSGTFDPIMLNSWTIGLYDTLLSWDENGNVIPNIAESYEMSPEGIWTFHIRRGIKFHNGDPLTAEDVKFSVDRYGDMSISQNPWSPYISASYNKKDSVVVDEYTYRFVGDHPELQQGSAFAAICILPKKYIEDVGEAGFNQHPVGSGPWKFVESVPNTSITMEANRDYWGQVPAYLYLIVQRVPEVFTIIAMLKVGDTDIALVDLDWLSEMTGRGFRTQVFGPPFLFNIAFQGTWLPSAGPTGDIRIRQAMSYAINRQEICDTLQQGYAKPGGMFLMHQGCYGWSDNLIPEPYDPARAKELLTEAGYPENFTDPTIHIYTMVYWQDYLAALTGYWEAVGLKVKMEIVDDTIFMGMMFSRPKEGDVNIGWAWFLGIQSQFNSTYGSANLYTSAGLYGTANDPKADRMYADYLAEADPVQAEHLWTDFQIYVKSLYISFGITEVEAITIVGPGVGEFTGRNWLGFEGLNGAQHPE
jgi:peptide/nickel transport system substrate-binding protein